MFLRILEERKFPVSELLPYATDRSSGMKTYFRGDEIPVKILNYKNIESCELALFSCGSENAKIWAREFVKAKALVVDNSSAFRADPDIPLVVPEVNSEDISRHNGIIANPNCSTIGLVVALYPLHRAFGLKSVIVTSFQSVSGAGRKALEELERQIEDPDSPAREFPHKIALNCLPKIGAFLESGETVEERKFRDESRKIMKIPHLTVSATAVRVPVKVGHSLSVHAQFEKPATAKEAKEILAKAPDLKLFSKDQDFPTPIEVAGQDAVFVGRVRIVEGFPHSLNLWVIVDNLRKGAATNAIQIAELALLNK
jgi:aspartate-semialdehyde dehydrogenase